MNIRILSTEQITAYDTYLRIEERAAGTREKYLRDVQAFVCWLNGAAVTKEAVTSWKERLLAEHRAPSTVNAALSALNGLFRFLGWEDCRTRFVRVQRRLFRDPARELTRPDYDRLIAAARELGRDRLALVMEAICSTGVRVSEIRYLTVEAVQRGRAEISLKGKVRTILIPTKLARKLLKYAKKNKTVSGEIFLTGNRQKPFKAADMGRNEAAVRPCGRGTLQGVPSQPAPLFCHGLLPGLPGYRKTGGRTGA